MLYFFTRILQEYDYRIYIRYLEYQCGQQMTSKTKLKGDIKMKKIICLITLAIALVCVLTACGGNKEAVATEIGRASCRERV